MLSVIIPLYNTQAYLDRCVQCILRQTYRNYEAIFVNDGSTDGSYEILEKYIDADDRIHIINQENKGLSGARNAGLMAARGDYIFFLDSDDWIEEDYFSECMKQLQVHRPDILFTPYVREYDTGPMPTQLYDERHLYFADETEVRNHVLLRLFGPIDGREKDPTKIDNLNTAWGKFYKGDLIKDMRFADRKTVGTAEDLWFNIEAFYRAHSAEYYGGQYLHYNKMNTASLVSTYHPEMVSIMKHLYQMMHSFITGHGLDHRYKSALRNRIVIQSFSHIVSLEYSDLSYIEKCRRCRDILEDDLFRRAVKGFSCKGMDKKWQIFYGLEKADAVTLVLAMTAAAVKLRARVKR